MDALPDVGQTCGHKIIATAGIGAGLALAAVADDLGIRVTVLGTPAEEGGGGKVDLINAGAFKDAAASMMIHPSGRDIVDPTFLAVQHLDVEFHGKDAHASSSPHIGINALDAGVQAYTAIAALRQHILPTDRIHGIFTSGGSAANIVPSYVSMTWYIRSLTDERLEELSKKVHACFEAATISTGCTHTVTPMGCAYKDIRNDTLMAGLYLENSAALGRDMLWTADAPSHSFGSTDMGNVSYEVPSIHPMLDLGASPAVNHQPEFAAYTITDDGMQMIRDGALAMAWTVVDLAEQDLWSELGSYRT
jgi:amidohydrolase